MEFFPWFLPPLIGSTAVPFVFVVMVVPTVGVHHGTCDVFYSGRYHHFVSTLVSAQSKDRFRGVSGGRNRPQAQLTTFSSMDQIINTLSLYALENGLLTTWVPTPGSTEPEF